MRIGVFDSGLGGLLVARAIAAALPDYDLLYLGDTKRVPFGGRSQEAIHGFVAEALDYLFAHDCHLVILACNTASAEALRKTQQEYLPNRYPDRRVLGVVIPMAEAVAELGAKNVGVLATRSTAASGAYEREIARHAPNADVHVVPSPLLAPLVENDGLKYADPILDDYLAELGLPSSCRRESKESTGPSSPREREEEGLGVVVSVGPTNTSHQDVGTPSPDCLVLGCTHYGLLKDRIRARLNVPVLASEDVVPAKLVDYLRRHPEHDERLSRNGERRYLVTDLGPGYEALARTFAGEDIRLDKVDL